MSKTPERPIKRSREGLENDTPGTVIDTPGTVRMDSDGELDEEDLANWERYNKSKSQQNEYKTMYLKYKKVNVQVEKLVQLDPTDIADRYMFDNWKQNKQDLYDANGMKTEFGKSIFDSPGKGGKRKKSVKKRRRLTKRKNKSRKRRTRRKK